MTRLWNAPQDFARESLDGFAAAHARWVRKVDGGVTRTLDDAEPQVAVVIGGGSGHYPTFAGLVGPGLAHGAAMGNLFASPSARQVESVSRASERGRGVLMSFGNYAGDVLHFGAAAEKLRQDGIDCRIVLVIDDVFSAPSARQGQRRGIAGDLVVFKIAGAAAQAGADLDRVEALARHANARTRSMGVAFTGCTLPGADEPLFSVPDGRMAIGLGIHGEPGIDEVDIPTADGLAELFAERLLDAAEIPAGVEPSDARVVPILNGLGSVKAEELFVVYRRIAQLLEARGVRTVDPQIGEFCTSFDMAGASLTLFWLDDELEELWLAPCDTPALRSSRTPVAVGVPEPTVLKETAPSRGFAAAEPSRETARCILTALEAVVARIDEHAAELGRIDAIAGDGDHGLGMQRGARAATQAARAAIRDGAGAGTTLALAGAAWSDVGGGTSGAIWGLILATLGEHVADEERPDAGRIAAAVADVSTRVRAFGKAEPGDKTMVDAIVPFAEALQKGTASGLPFAVAWRAASARADEAARATAGLLPRRGRARTHGSKSVGTPDPGAISFALITDAVAATLETENR